MQIRRENIFTLILSIVGGFLLQYQVTTLPPWLLYLLDGVVVIGILGSILSMTPIWDRRFKKKSITTSIVASTSNNTMTVHDYSHISKIKQQAPSDRPSALFNAVFMLCAIVLLIAAGMMIYFFVTDKTEIKQIDPALWWILFSLFLIAYPLWIIIDTLVFEPRQYKLGRSRVAKEKTIDYVGDIELIFNAFYEASIKREFSIINVDRPKQIKAQLRRYIVTITFKHMQKGKVRVNILSDSVWRTTKFDFGWNRKNLDIFELSVNEILSNKRNEETQEIARISEERKDKMEKSLILTPRSWAIGLSGMTGYPNKPDGTYWLRLEVSVNSTYDEPIDTLDLLIGTSSPIPANDWSRRKVAAFTVYFNINDWKQKGEFQVELQAHIKGVMHSSGRIKVDFNAEPGGFARYL